MKKINHSHAYYEAHETIGNVISQITSFFYEIAGLIGCIPSPIRVPIIALAVISFGSLVARLF